MREWLKRCARSMTHGFTSIGRGMSTFSIWPSTYYQAMIKDSKESSNYWKHLRPEKTDLEALKGDWEAVGRDMNSALESRQTKSRKP